MLAALHYLALAEGIDPWSDPAGAVAGHAGFVRRFVREQSVQTNEVQRTWALLPAFLSLGRAELDLIELGPSAGLNLVWDRHRFHYEAGSWGAAGTALELRGEERLHVPAALLGRDLRILRRRGIDREPIDVTSEDGARLLRSFVWADQDARLERLERAIEAVRAEPPQLVAGDYVDVLPGLLSDRVDGALAVVFQTASTIYLPAERYAALRHALADAERPLAWISTRRRDEMETQLEDGFELELACWPEQPPRVVARMGYHGQWLEWLG